jgi:hypothetical protein
VAAVGVLKDTRAASDPRRHEQSVIVWDLETIPDLAAEVRMLDLAKAPNCGKLLWFGVSEPPAAQNRLHQKTAALLSPGRGLCKMYRRSPYQ